MHVFGVSPRAIGGMLERSRPSNVQLTTRSASRTSPPRVPSASGVLCFPSGRRLPA